MVISILFKVVVSCSYVENDATLDASEYDFKAFSSNNSSYGKAYVVTPKPNLQTIYAGSKNGFAF